MFKDENIKLNKKSFLYELGVLMVKGEADSDIQEIVQSLVSSMTYSNRSDKKLIRIGMAAELQNKYNNFDDDYFEEANDILTNYL